MSFLSSIFGVKTLQSEAVEIIGANTFKQKINKHNVNLFDVRTAVEFNRGTIKNAINVDFFNKIKFLKHFENLDKSEPVYLFCRSGNRSNKAAQLLAKQGFAKIYDLQGGYIAWKNL